MEHAIPIQPKNSTRVILELNYRESRLDNILIATMRNQSENLKLKNVSRTELKKLFSEGKIQIKGQRAKTSSAVAQGITYVDILGL